MRRWKLTNLERERTNVHDSPCRLKNHNANVENALKHCKDNFLGLLSRLGVTRHDLDRIITEVYQAEVTAPAPELSGEVKEEMPPSNALTNYGEMEELD